MEYRLILKIIEATQWFKNGDHPLDESILNELGELSEGKIIKKFRHVQVDGGLICNRCSQVMDNHGWIENANGRSCSVCPSDYIITNEDGFYYPWKESAFKATYESTKP